MGSRAAKLGWVIVALVAACVLLVNLEGTPIRPYDEGLYARLARNALATGQWMYAVEPDGSFSDRFSKPPLSLWLTALSMALFGPSTFSLRLPFALCAWLGICVCMTWGMRARGPRFGLCWGAALTLCGASLRWGRYACIEPMFVCFGLLALWGHAESLAASGRQKLGWASLAGIGLALAFMTKQLAVGLFAAPILLVELVGRRSFGERRWLRWALSFGTPALLGGAWLVWMATQVGPEFGEVYFSQSIGARMVGFAAATNRRELDELATIVAEVVDPFPWVLGAVAMLVAPWWPSERGRPCVLSWSMAALLLTGVLLYDQVARTLLPWYAFGLVPAITAGLAWAIARVPELDADTPAHEWLAGGVGLAALAIAVVTSLAVYVSRMSLILGLALLGLLALRRRLASVRARDGVLVLGFVAILAGTARDLEFRRGPGPYALLMRELGARGLERVAVDRNIELPAVELAAYFGPGATSVRAAPWHANANVDAYVTAELPPEQLVPEGVELLRVDGAVALIGDLSRPAWSLELTRGLLDAGPISWEAEHMPSERVETLRRDDAASGGWARAVVPFRRERVERSFLTNGPHWSLPRGRYRADFRVRWTCPRQDVRVGQVWVVSNGQEFGHADLACAREQSQDWTDVAVEFELGRTTPIELRVISEAGELWHDRTTIIRQ